MEGGFCRNLLYDVEFGELERRVPHEEEREKRKPEPFGRLGLTFRWKKGSKTLIVLDLYTTICEKGGSFSS